MDNLNYNLMVIDGGGSGRGRRYRGRNKKVMWDNEL